MQNFHTFSARTGKMCIRVRCIEGVLSPVGIFISQKVLLKLRAHTRKNICSFVLPTESGKVHIGMYVFSNYVLVSLFECCQGD